MRVLLSVLATTLVLSKSAHGLCSYQGAALEGMSVVPPTGVTWGGGIVLFVCDGPLLHGTLVINGPETVTAVHLHGPAGIGETGPLVMDLPLPRDGDGGVEFQDIPVNAEQIAAIESVLMSYVDVHTVEHPGGAVRGQVGPEIAVEPSTWGFVKQLFR
jgi:hypothetical protein